MRLGAALATAAVVALAAPAIAADRSGPEVGAHATAFDVEDVTGPHKGKTLCYV